MFQVPPSSSATGGSHKKPSSSAKKSAQQQQKMAVIQPTVRKEDNKGSMMNRAADVRKISEMEKRMGDMTSQKEKMKEKTMKLAGELDKVRTNLNHTQQERGRMQQFWNIAEIKLENEKLRGRDVEKTMFELKSQQAQHVQQLQQRIRSLVLNAKTHRHASTQSECIPPSGEVTSSECQTVDEMSREKASSLLRQSDDLLTVFISELEKEKLNAQSDLKYAIVQLEQRMKEEMETKIKTMREEREIEIEEIGLKHIEQLRSIESSHNEETSTLLGKIDFLQKEVSTLRDHRDAISQNLEDSRLKVQDQARDLGKANASIDEMSKEIGRLQEYKRNFQRDMKNVESMRKEVDKYKDLNEIVMGEFAKIEAERDLLLAEVEKNLERMDRSNQQRFENFGRHNK